MAEQTEQLEEAPRTDPSERLILVIDDDSEMRLLLESLIKKEGFRLAQAAGGREGLALVEKETPDLILLDLMLPDIGGYELLREMQAAGASSVPIILMTARTIDQSTRDMMKREGNVIEFLAKPLRPTILGMRLHDILKTRPAPGL